MEWNGMECGRSLPVGKHASTQFIIQSASESVIQHNEPITHSLTHSPITINSSTSSAHTRHAQPIASSRHSAMLMRCAKTLSERGCEFQQSRNKVLKATGCNGKISEIFYKFFFIERKPSSSRGLVVHTTHDADHT